MKLLWDINKEKPANIKISPTIIILTVAFYLRPQCNAFSTYAYENSTFR